MIRRTLTATAAFALAVSLVGCSVEGARPAPESTPAATDAAIPDAPGTAASEFTTDDSAADAAASTLTRSTVGARSVLTGSGVDVSSTLERRAVELFSELDARQEDASAVIELAELTDDVPITIVGHTDGRGSDERNAELSEDRATAVADALIAAGVAADRITAEGVGSTQPVAEEGGTDDEDARAQNRRVEVTFEGIDLEQ